MANYTQHKAVYQNPYEQKIRQTLNADERAQWVLYSKAFLKAGFDETI